MAEMDNTFYQIPAIMPTPHRPQGRIALPEGEGLDDLNAWSGDVVGVVDDLLRWSREMHSSIYDSYIPQTDRIENMIMIGQTIEERPRAIGSRRFFYLLPDGPDEDGVLYLDARYGDKNWWDVISFAEVAEGITKTSPIIGGGGSGSDTTLDTTDFDNVLSVLDDDVQKAMDTLDDHLHAIIEVASSEPADGALDNGQAVFWYEAAP